MKKPIGLWIWTIFHLFNFLGLLIIGGMSFFLQTPILAKFYSLGVWGSLFFLVIPIIISAGVVIGFFTQKPFGHYFNISYIGLGFLSNLMFLITYAQKRNLLNIVFLGLVGYYLYRKRSYYIHKNPK